MTAVRKREPPVQLPLFAAAEPAVAPLTVDDGLARAGPAWRGREPGFDEPGFDEPGANEPGADEPGADEPAANEPAANEPAADEPGGAEPLPDIFRHPLAEREIRLGDRLVGYRLIRARRRSIGFMVGADGLSVSVPKWIGAGDIDSALREKSRWILRKLAEQQERSRLLAQARIEWRDGTAIPYLGEALAIVVDARAMALPDRAALHTEVSAPPGLPRMTLHLGLPEGAAPAELRLAVQAWLQRQARKLFEERCAIYARKIGVRPGRIRLSSAQTRWGSASADGTIRLNWRLIHFCLATVDYVVAHELAHLCEMNHSPRFWAVVRSAFPDYETARQRLKAGSVPMFD